MDSGFGDSPQSFTSSEASENGRRVSLSQKFDVSLRTVRDNPEKHVHDDTLIEKLCSAVTSELSPSLIASIPSVAQFTRSVLGSNNYDPSVVKFALSIVTRLASNEEAFQTIKETIDVHSVLEGLAQSDQFQHPVIKIAFLKCLTALVQAQISIRWLSDSGLLFRCIHDGLLHASGYVNREARECFVKVLSSDLGQVSSSIASALLGLLPVHLRRLSAPALSMLEAFLSAFETVIQLKQPKEDILQTTNSLRDLLQRFIYDQSPSANSSDDASKILERAEYLFILLSGIHVQQTGSSPEAVFMFQTVYQTLLHRRLRIPRVDVTLGSGNGFSRSPSASTRLSGRECEAVIQLCSFTQQKVLPFLSLSVKDCSYQKSQLSLLAFQVIPLLVYFEAHYSDRLDSAYVAVNRRMSNSKNIAFRELHSVFREDVAQLNVEALEDLIVRTAGGLSRNAILFIEENEVTCLQCLLLITLAMVKQPERPGRKLISTVVDLLSDFLTAYKMSWSECYETKCLVLLLTHLCFREDTTPCITVKVFRAIRLALVAGALPLELMLSYTGDPSKASQIFLATFFRKELQSPHWEVRDSALETLATIVEISRSKCPSLQGWLKENDLVKSVVRSFLAGCSIYKRFPCGEGDHYIRAASLQLLKNCSEVRSIWEDLVEDETRIMDCSMAVLCSDPESVSRLAGVAFLSTVLFNEDIRNRLPSYMRQNMRCKLQAAAYGDLDSEVKCEAVKYWKKVLYEELSAIGYIDDNFPAKIYDKGTKKMLEMTPENIRKKLNRVLEDLSGKQERVGVCDGFKLVVNDLESVPKERTGAGCLVVLLEALNGETQQVQNLARSVLREFRDILIRYGVVKNSSHDSYFEPPPAKRRARASASTSSSTSSSSSSTSMKPKEKREGVVNGENTAALHPPDLSRDEMIETVLDLQDVDKIFESIIQETENLPLFNAVYSAQRNVPSVSKEEFLEKIQSMDLKEISAPPSHLVDQLLDDLLGELGAHPDVEVITDCY
ncbi:unnamed protein product [Cyprideis torosa]|uniref:Uncharacterized protein n=1 Tax=Cyprideis torosa TaxID=163714 RepID=A0A7R8ZPF9_9CRUS|nr:unnamed protein product [Cyprideis torosa]CAG0889779.1 unnamed protein product [Cyprideis torosa]